jgi:hypothetical protein
VLPWWFILSVEGYGVWLEVNQFKVMAFFFQAKRGPQQKKKEIHCIVSLFQYLTLGCDCLQVVSP